MRTILSSESKRYSARRLASSVLPTPVGPKKRKEPIGLPGSLRPALLRWIAPAMVSIASSCPIMHSFSLDFIFIILLPSDSATLLTGMPVILDTTVAMSSSVTMLPDCLRRTIEPASSIASIALSGRDLSAMYLSVSLTQASIASSV